MNFFSKAKPAEPSVAEEQKASDQPAAEQEVKKESDQPVSTQAEEQKGQTAGEEKSQVTDGTADVTKNEKARPPRKDGEKETAENEIMVAAKGKIKSYLGYAFRILNKTDYRSLKIKATGNAIVKALILVELIKKKVGEIRNYELHQCNQIYSMEIITQEESKIEGMDKIESRRRVTAMDTILSKDPLDESEPGYQFCKPEPKDTLKDTPGAGANDEKRKKDRQKKKRGPRNYNDFDKKEDQKTKDPAEKKSRKKDKKGEKVDQPRRENLRNLINDDENQRKFKKKRGGGQRPPPMGDFEQYNGRPPRNIRDDFNVNRPMRGGPRQRGMGPPPPDYYRDQYYGGHGGHGPPPSYYGYNDPYYEDRYFYPREYNDPRRMQPMRGPPMMGPPGGPKGGPPPGHHGGPRRGPPPHGAGDMPRGGGPPHGRGGGDMMRDGHRGGFRDDHRDMGDMRGGRGGRGGHHDGRGGHHDGRGGHHEGRGGHHEGRGGHHERGGHHDKGGRHPREYNDGQGHGPPRGDHMEGMRGGPRMRGGPLEGGPRMRGGPPEARMRGGGGPPMHAGHMVHGSGDDMPHMPLRGNRGRGRGRGGPFRGGDREDHDGDRDRGGRHHGEEIPRNPPMIRKRTRGGQKTFNDE